jgi:hypothetical protein
MPGKRHTSTFAFSAKIAMLVGSCRRFADSSSAPIASFLRR